MSSLRLRVGAVVFLLLAGLAICWAFATPLFGISDEPAHIMKAAAVARGQLIGKEDGGPNTIVQIPGNLIGNNRLPCFAFSTNLTASCATPLGNDDRTVPELTWTGYYPPLYYLLVGWPSLIFNGSAAIYAMRIVSALCGAALLVCAFLSAAEARGRALLLPATAALSTPYLFAYMGAVNPSGVEMAAAISAWCAGMVLVDGPPRPNHRWVVARFVVSLFVLTEVRDFGPLFLAVIVATLGAWYGVRRSWHLLRDLRVRLIAGVIGLGGVLTAVWVLFIANLSFAPGSPVARGTGPLGLLARSATRYFTDVPQLVGDVGWANRSPSQWVSFLGVSIMAALLAVGVWRAEKRQRIVILLLLAFAIAFPIILVAIEATRQGLLGQARYWFPLTAGALLVAAEAGGAKQVRRNWLVWGVVGLVTLTIHLITFPVILEKFRFGSGPHAGPTWNPPGGAPLLFVAYGVLSVGLVGWWWRRLKVSKDPVLI
jgi:Predicted membrane protein (DUF2142)